MKKTFPNSFYESSITLIPTPDKDSAKKVIDQSLTHKDAKIINKMDTKTTLRN